MRLWLRRLCFRSGLGDWRHGFRSRGIRGQNNAESTRIRRIRLLLENLFPRLCESSTKDEVNVTTLALGIRRTRHPLCTSTFPVEAFNTSFSTHSSVGITGPGLSSPLSLADRETRYTSDWQLRQISDIYRWLFEGSFESGRALDRTRSVS